VKVNYDGTMYYMGDHECEGGCYLLYDYGDNYPWRPGKAASETIAEAPVVNSLFQLSQMQDSADTGAASAGASIISDAGAASDATPSATPHATPSATPAGLVDDDGSNRSRKQHWKNLRLEAWQRWKLKHLEVEAVRGARNHVRGDGTTEPQVLVKWQELAGGLRPTWEPRHAIPKLAPDKLLAFGCPAAKQLMDIQAVDWGTGRIP
jgi:hypothetical protein